uniref:Uncharacterized protein n=1 Tax=Globodera pallida TaxID=36090 RepID=A0A183BL68_GLOPA
MVESILAQIMTEQIHCATTNETGKDENESSQIVEEEKLTDEERERREKANVVEEAEKAYIIRSYTDPQPGHARTSSGARSLAPPTGRRSRVCGTLAGIFHLTV